MKKSKIQFWQEHVFFFVILVIFKALLKDMLVVKSITYLLVISNLLRKY